MKQIMSLLLVVAMAATYVLLAVQAEPVTATLGYVFAVLLTLAVIAQTLKKGN